MLCCFHSDGGGGGFKEGGFLVRELPNIRLGGFGSIFIFIYHNPFMHFPPPPFTSTFWGGWTSHFGCLFPLLNLH